MSDAPQFRLVQFAVIILSNALIALLAVLPAEVTAQVSFEFGYAIMYSEQYAGKATASGQLYDPGALSAGHTALPFGARIRVTSLENNQSVEVTVNDRISGEQDIIVKLSRTAAEQLEMLKGDKIRVKLDIITSSDAQPQQTTPSENNANLVIGLPPKARKKLASEQPATPPVQPATSQKPAENETTPPPKSIEAKKEIPVYDLYKIRLLRPKKEGFGVQVAYMSDQGNAFLKIAELQALWFENILLSMEPGPENKPVYRIFLGPFPDRPTAASYSRNLTDKFGIEGFIVDLETLQFGAK